MNQIKTGEYTWCYHLDVSGSWLFIEIHRHCIARTVEEFTQTLWPSLSSPHRTQQLAHLVNKQIREGLARILLTIHHYMKLTTHVISWAFSVTTQNKAARRKTASMTERSWRALLVLSRPNHSQHTHPFHGPFSGTTQVSRYQKGKLIWILQKQETVSSSGISWAICRSAPRSRQITMPVPHHSVFYRPDALPAAQPTASKHWRQYYRQSTEGSNPDHSQISHKVAR